MGVRHREALKTCLTLGKTEMFFVPRGRSPHCIIFGRGDRGGSSGGGEGGGSRQSSGIETLNDTQTLEG